MNEKTIWLLFGQYWKKLGSFLFHYLVTLMEGPLKCTCRVNVILNKAVITSTSSYLGQCLNSAITSIAFHVCKIIEQKVKKFKDNDKWSNCPHCLLAGLPTHIANLLHQLSTAKNGATYPPLNTRQTGPKKLYHLGQIPLLFPVFLFWGVN